MILPSSLSINAPAGSLWNHNRGFEHKAKHCFYSAGWKKSERVWDLLIRVKQLAQMRPALEAVLSPTARHVEEATERAVGYSNIVSGERNAGDGRLPDGMPASL